MKCQHEPVCHTIIILMSSVLVTRVAMEQDGDHSWTLNGDQRYNDQDQDGSVSDPSLPLSGDNICTRRET